MLREVSLVKNRSKYIFLSLILFLYFAHAAATQENVYDGKNKLFFSQYLLLESPEEKGKWLSLDENTPGVTIYTGGSLPSSLSSLPKMYTFKTSFKLPANPESVPISLYMGLTEYPYALYLNGSEIFRKGRNTPRFYNSSMRAAYNVFLPPDMLYHDRANEIVLEIYPRFETNALDILYLDSSDAISQSVFLRNFFGINLIQGAFVLSMIIGLYFFILYLAEKQRQKTRLIFALFCFAYFFATIAIATHHDTSNEIALENLSKFGLLLSVTFLLRFFMEFTGVLNKIRPLRIGIYSLGCIAAAGALFQQSKEALTSWFSLSIIVVVIPGLIFSLAVLLVAIFRHRQKVYFLLLCAYSVMLIAAAHDVYYLSRDALPYAWLITYGYFAIVLSIFALLAGEQARMYHESLQSEADILVDRNRIKLLNEELVRQKDSFYRFVPTEFLELLGRKSVVDIKLGDSSLRYLTILFTDIRKFTSIAEGMLPMEIFEFLNSYLFRMEKAVQGNGGFVDKYIGDGVMALFPTGQDVPEKSISLSADNSLKAALQIKRELYLFNQEMKAQNILPIQIGVGINTGDVTLGTVGSDTRLDTTVIGDAVNLSSRLESLTKLYRTQNLISEYTINALERPGDFSLRMIDTVSVPGRTKSVRIFELLEPEILTDRVKEACLKDFANAVNLYTEQEFDRALTLFCKLSESCPEDYVSEIYAERCRSYQKKSAESGWDGVFRITEK